MKYNKKTNCNGCGYPLHIQDLKETRWGEDYLEFVFVCCSCDKENLVRSKLFRNGHISRNFLRIVKEDKDYLPADKLQLLHKHLEECDECRNKFNEEYLLEVEEKIKFNEYSLRCLENKGQIVNKELPQDTTVMNDGEVKSFYYGVKKYETDEDFFRQKFEDHSEVCYYLKNGNELTEGLACFHIFQDRIFVHKIWLMSEDLLNKKKQIIQRIKEDGKIRLETLIKIYHSLGQSLKNEQ